MNYTSLWILIFWSKMCFENGNPPAKGKYCEDEYSYSWDEAHDARIADRLEQMYGR